MSKILWKALTGEMPQNLFLFVRNQESSLISLDINEEHKDKCQNNTYHEQVLTHTNICL